ncbi:MAG: XRE family transcriptional regulator [Gammaproteobacteria bacterium]|nr:XRE family transcriptional regulator [Gammaproteobacteria bacterium]
MPESSISIGQRLVKARKAARLTQGELGARSGLSQRLVSNIECGHIKGSIETLTRLAKVLGVSVSHLAGERVQEWQEGGGRDEVLKDPLAPVGLQGLARNGALCDALAITAEEWAALRAIKLSYLLPQEAYSAILLVMRSSRPSG